ncbi:DUF2971 domain-containing protein [Myroides odoratimimus]|uniref:DUF2971 domain-containing protein n=1 Tax=Myroides odoratimimus TaxID=76832 RepID=UPI0009249200|nr:DUF2971 domain-containing protein [Myroides odoratimimus]SHM20345.1 Protein of unknown function [Myroides odoratimimus subsp. xuanwuensis]
MWSHYTDKYQGVCLIFDTSKASTIFTFKGDKVKYRKNLVKKFYDATTYFDLTDVLYSKNLEWSYENEVREVIENTNINAKGSKVLFDPKNLVGIIFGVKIEEEKKQQIKDLIISLNKYDIEYIDSYIDYQDNSIKLQKNSLNLI